MDDAGCDGADGRGRAVLELAVIAILTVVCLRLAGVVWGREETGSVVRGCAGGCAESVAIGCGIPVLGVVIVAAVVTLGGMEERPVWPVAVAVILLLVLCFAAVTRVRDHMAEREARREDLRGD